MFNVEDFTSKTNIAVKTNVPGGDLTTVKVGGPVHFLIPLQSVQDACAAIKYFQLNSRSYRILGAGSNLLIPDSGVFDPVVQLTGELATYSVDGTFVRAGGGVSLMRLSRDMCNLGLSGLEFAGGIPGSIGGAVRMNAGAHKGDMSQIVIDAQVVSSTGELQTFTASQLEFAYRKSSLAPDQIVVMVLLKLSPSSKEETTKRRAENLEARKSTQPLQLPSFGSVFKNPPGESAGALIEQAGLKGTQIGGAAVSEKHANWIVNPERKASAADVVALIEKCQSEVLKRFNIELHPEVVRW